MSKVFICYRRDDASGNAGRLYDHVGERLGESSVFMDVDTIPPGERFDEYIDDSLRNCDVCLVVIGRQWSTERLKDNDDFVRREILGAFSRKIRVVPVLFDGATLPSADKLPSQLAELAYCQAYNFGSGREFKHQVAELLTDINKAIRQSQERRIRQSREALRTVALRPYQYPLWVLFICGFIILSASLSLNLAPVEVNALSNLWKAKDAATKGDRSTGISAFRSVLADVPTSRDAKIGLASLLFADKSRNDSEEAMNLLYGIELSAVEWDDLKKVVPREYQQLFVEKKK